MPGTVRTSAPASKRKRFTPSVLQMKAPARRTDGKPARVEIRDDLTPLWFRITEKGERSFAVRVRVKGQAQPVRITYPEPAHVSNLSAAREWAVRAYGDCRRGIDPGVEKRAVAASQAAQRAHEQKASFKTVAAQFLATNGVFKKNSRGWKPRTRVEYERTINQRLIARWGDRQIHSITRDEVTDYLAELADTAPVAANRALALLGTMMNWHQAQRGSAFTSPIVKGMAPTQETARERILNDGELRLVWRVAERSGTFGAIVHMLLLTGARRSEVASMQHSQIGADGIWALPGPATKNWEPLYLPLPGDALRLITAQPRFGGQDLVFSIGGKCEFTNWSRSKADFDARVLRRLRAQTRLSGGRSATIAPPPNWCLHDLRRTARSLMARAKVRPDHAERVLNHKIGGVEGTYDRHSYEDEKRDALERLERILHQIVGGEPAKVVRFPTRAAAR